MKKLLVCLIAGLAATSALAKDETLLDNSDTWKLYTRPEFSLTRFAGQDAWIGDIGIGATINNKLSLGPQASILLQDLSDNRRGDLRKYNLWYVGGRAEYTLYSEKLVHFSGSLAVGTGDIKVDDPVGSGHATSSVVVTEPGLNAAVNVAKGFELGAGVGYRWFSTFSDRGWRDKDLDNWTFSLFARFTEF